MEDKTQEENEIEIKKSVEINNEEDPKSEEEKKIVENKEEIKINELESEENPPSDKEEIPFDKGENINKINEDNLKKDEINFLPNDHKEEEKKEPKKLEEKDPAIKGNDQSPSYINLLELDKIKESQENIDIPPKIEENKVIEEAKLSQNLIEKKAKIAERRNSRFEIMKKSSENLLRPEFIGYPHSKEDKNKKLWDLMASYQDASKEGIQKSIVNHVEYTLALTRFNFDNHGAYKATSYSVRDRLIESWNDTNLYIHGKNPKRIYYLSMEYLLGRQLKNSLICLGIMQSYDEAIKELGFNLNELFDEEMDPALGNGGLGRLAACYLDSLASLEIPSWAYGIRYNYGIFKQEIHHGCQVEFPDYWLTRGNPWEIERTDVKVEVFFSGKTIKYKDGNVERTRWEPSEKVIAMAYDTPIPGYETFNTNNLRLWRSCPANEFDFSSFNTGDYYGSYEDRQKAEEISSVLYPNDNFDIGKMLRLRQEYFFVAATMHDIIRRFLKKHNNWDLFPTKVAIQLNDTHPTLAIIELIRILLDIHKLTYDQAWRIAYKTFGYTNHTVLPEALEAWPVDMFEKILPRHLEIIYLINHLFLQQVRKCFPNQNNKIIESLSFIDEKFPRKVRMANICVVCSHAVNGVAELHSKILKESLFKDFYDFYAKFEGGNYAKKFMNITNGVTPRRFIVGCNPELANLISTKLENRDWIKNLDLLEELELSSKDPDFISKFINIRFANKKILQDWVKKNCNIDIPLDALYDIQVKRIHEYKRQLMNALYAIHRYFLIKESSPQNRKKMVKRVIFFGGKAAPGYKRAKNIIRLINSIGYTINNDKEVGDLLKVVFLPNYCVSLAEIIIPATDLSQQISTAGMEASGTGNMKFAMNGALIIGTMDGANIEIAEKIGKENMFIFGAYEDKIKEYRKQMASGKRDYVPHSLKFIFDNIYKGKFGDFRDMFELFDSILNGNDHYCICWDWGSYLEAQSKVDQLYLRPNEWYEKCINSIARMGFFSSDRSITEYAEKIWEVKAERIPNPANSPLNRVLSNPENLKENSN